MTRSRRAREPLGAFDVVGLSIVLVLGAWVAFAAGGRTGRPGPLLSLLVCLVVAFGAGRSRAARAGCVPRVVATGVAGAVLLTWPGVLRSGGAPTGYANANATLMSLGVLAAIGAASVTANPQARRRWMVLGGGLAAATVLTGSVAGSASLALALVLVGAGKALRRSRLAIIGGAFAVVVALGLTAAIALGADPGGLGERSELRGELWAAAADLIQEAPLQGIGPGEFADRNPVSVDPDLRWAHHGYLQVGAELGMVGLLLVLAVGAWLWVSLWRVSDMHDAAEWGAGALLIVALHATVDWVWHVPAVLIVLALVLGDASAGGTTGTDVRSRRRSGQRGEHRPGHPPAGPTRRAQQGPVD